jgi:hypothetical protein
VLKKDPIIAPVCEALLLFIVGIAGWLTHTPLIFASLGPTAYEMIETPTRPSARPYNVIAGHFIAVVMGFVALGLTHAWYVPAVSTSVPLLRVWAAVIAAMFTVLATLLARASQPAALSTALLIALGTLQTSSDALYIMAAVLFMTLAGEPLRRWRMGQPQNLASHIPSTK